MTDEFTPQPETLSQDIINHEIYNDTERGLNWDVKSTDSIDPGHQHTSASVVDLEFPAIVYQSTSGSDTGSSGFTISSLDLDTDLCYHIILVVTNSNAGDGVKMLLNGDTGANYQFETVENGAGAESTSQAFIQISSTVNTGVKQAYDIKIMRNEASDGTSVIWTGGRFGAGVANSLDSIFGVGYYFSTTNIASVTFNPTANTFSYRYFIMKLT